ncbi:Na+/H+ antiporter [Clostridium sp. OS1-26]|uniref:Na+/H+ antiporter n=1 Tax=Clostridium sp. OS1-26 TaxID=3070681 RepID=UPI0027E0FF03|nr:Na+/H+ antiporter [Clostridium sp. OS1-26]WML33626.1 Na+/H+ antiporter [Clostridium sp. OS1-26]
MEIFIIILILLASIGVSNIINRFIPSFPIPLVQISLGMILAILPLGIHMTLEPELFLVLFIAPLLFNDGKRVSRNELWSLRTPILLMALGLVFVTVFIVGHVIHWMIPSITLSAAFALAAILSPTDAVAVQALSKRIHLPKKIMNLLEGEALINDASGLVAFKFAVAATVSGSFSLIKATASFFIIAIGGLLCGVVLSFLIIHLRRFIRRLGMEDVTIQMLIQILTPFFIYLVSEHLGVSGILAVVSGGIIHSIEHERMESFMLKLQIVSTSTWFVILFILNGLVFLILGLQIPGVIKIIFEDEKFNNLQVFGYIVVISIILTIIRFLWVYIFGEGKLKFRKEELFDKSRFKAAVLTSLSGVRGAVTLAGAFSIPYVLQGGAPFPQRDLIIFISAGVILFSLLETSIILPILVKKEEHSKGEDKNKIERKALIKVIEASIKALKEEIDDENKKAALNVIDSYNKYIRKSYRSENQVELNLQSSEMKKNIYAKALKVEEKEIEQLFKAGEISQNVYNILKEKFNHTESILSNELNHKVILAISIIKGVASKVFSSYKNDSMTDVKEIETAKISAYNAAIAAIRKEINDENRGASLEIIAHYNEIIRRIQKGSQPKDNEQFNKHKRELQFKAIEVQRKEVQSLFENGEINRELANKLRRFINYWEATLME